MPIRKNMIIRAECMTAKAWSKSSDIIDFDNDADDRTLDPAIRVALGLAAEDAGLTMGMTEQQAVQRLQRVGYEVIISSIPTIVLKLLVGLKYDNDDALSIVRVRIQTHMLAQLRQPFIWVTDPNKKSHVASA